MIEFDDLLALAQSINAPTHASTFCFRMTEDQREEATRIAHEFMMDEWGMDMSREPVGRYVWTPALDG